MKSTHLLRVSVCLLILQNAAAQTNFNTQETNNTSDSRSYVRMVKYISEQGTVVKNTAPIEEAMRANSGESRLVVPIRSDPSVPAQATTMSYDKFLPSVYVKDPLQGSPFLLPYYVQGLVVNRQDSVIYKPEYLYNYDKMSGNFLLEKNNEHPIAVDGDLVKAFCLKTDQGGYIFERMPAINNDEFFQVIFKGPKYSFYKLYKSNLVLSHKTTNGYITEGNNYDEYVDIVTYYVIDHRSNDIRIFELKKHGLKKAIPQEEDLIQQYFKTHKILDIDDTYLAKLAETINNH